MTFNDNNNNSNISIKDTNSQFARFLPNKWIEPLIIIAKIRGYRGIDDYILALIKSRLQMFVDTCDTIEYDEFQEYMHSTIMGKDVPNEWVRSNTKKEESKENVSDFVKKIHDEQSYSTIIMIYLLEKK
jgi:hypothetical protein